MSFAKLFIVGAWSCVSDGEIHILDEKTRLNKKLAKIKEEHELMVEVVVLMQVQLRSTRQDCVRAQLIRRMSPEAS